MRNGFKKQARERVLGVLGALALAATTSCAPGAAAEVGRPHTTSQTGGHRCIGSQGSSRIARSTDADGWESLRGDTDVPWRPGAIGRLHLSESATLDARGQLVRARVIATQPLAPVTAFVLEPYAARVRILRDGSDPIDWPVPADAPWIYRPSSSAEGMLASTPIAAWVLARAAAGNPVVRMLIPERQQSYLVPIDQVAVATEKGTTVVLDADGVDTDADFVTEVRLADRSLTLECAALASDAAR
jgi:hypothetical protein